MTKQITGDEPANILTIRQEFAARAMQALLTAKLSSDADITSYMKVHPDKTLVEIVCMDGVKIADALIAELNKEVQS